MKKGPPKFHPNSVTYDELENNAFKMMAYFETLTDSANNHFTEQDVMDALESYHDRFITYPREAIEYQTGIAITPFVKRRKNPLKQKDHLEEARTIRDLRMKRQGRK